MAGEATFDGDGAKLVGVAAAGALGHRRIRVMKGGAEYTEAVPGAQNSGSGAGCPVDGFTLWA